MFLQIPVASLTLVFRIYKNNIIVPESMPSGAHNESERSKKTGTGHSHALKLKSIHDGRVTKDRLDDDWRCTYALPPSI